MADAKRQQAFVDSEAEVKKIIEIINNSGTGYKAFTAKTFYGSTYTTERDLRMGDFFIRNLEPAHLHIDAKRNWKISVNCIKNFVGDYILFYENKNYEMEFIPFKVLRDYVADMEPEPLSISGDLGYEIKRGHIRARKTLEEI